MSDTPQQYILRQPIVFTFAKENPYDLYVRFTKQRKLWFDRPTFDEVFVPLDVQALEKQLIEIIAERTGNIYELGQQRSRTNDNYMDVRDQRSFLLEEIKALFGLHNTEETDNE